MPRPTKEQILAAAGALKNYKGTQREAIAKLSVLPGFHLSGLGTFTPDDLVGTFELYLLASADDFSPSSFGDGEMIPVVPLG